MSAAAAARAHASEVRKRLLAAGVREPEQFIAPPPPEGPSPKQKRELARRKRAARTQRRNRDLPGPKLDFGLTEKRLIRLAAALMQVSMADMMGESLDRDITRARQFSYLLCWLLLPRTSLSSIARAHNRKDHTTTMHGIRRAYARLHDLDLDDDDE